MQFKCKLAAAVVSAAADIATDHNKQTASQPEAIDQGQHPGLLPIQAALTVRLRVAAAATKERLHAEQRAVQAKGDRIQEARHAQ
jgi:hypothetical protein